MLDEAINIVSAKCGMDAANTKPELVAAVMQSLALEEATAQFQTIMKETSDAICQAAAVAAGD